MALEVEELVEWGLQKTLSTLQNWEYDLISGRQINILFTNPTMVLNETQRLIAQVAVTAARLAVEESLKEETNLKNLLVMIGINTGYTVFDNLMTKYSNWTNEPEYSDDHYCDDNCDCNKNDCDCNENCDCQYDKNDDTDNCDCQDEYDKNDENDDNNNDDKLEQIRQTFDEEESNNNESLAFENKPLNDNNSEVKSEYKFHKPFGGFSSF